MNWQDVISGLRQRFGEEETAIEKQYRNLLSGLRQRGLGSSSWSDALNQAYITGKSDFQAQARNIYDLIDFLREQDEARQAQRQQAESRYRQQLPVMGRAQSLWGQAMGRGWQNPMAGAYNSLSNFMAQHPEVFGPGGIGYDFGQKLAGEVAGLPTLREWRTLKNV